MAINIPSQLRLAQPVSSFLKGRALRMASQQAEQDFALGEQQRELNELKLEQARNPQPETPDPSDVLDVQKIERERGTQIVRGYEALRESAGDEAAQEWASGEAARTRQFIRKNYPFMSPFLQDGEWNYDVAKSALGQMEEGDQRDRKIQDAMELGGLDRAQAVDLVDGYLNVSSTPDRFGNVTITNERTQDAFQIPARSAGQIGLDVQTETPERQPTERSSTEIPRFFEIPVTAAPGLSAQNVQEAQARLGSVNRILAFSPGAIDVMKGGDVAGPGNIVQRGIGGAANILSLGAVDWFSEERFNKKSLMQFNKMVEEGFISNPRFPVAERNFVQTLLPNPDDVTSNDRRALVDLMKVITTVANRGEADLAALEGRPANLMERPRTGFKIDPLEVKMSLSEFGGREDEIEQYIRSQPTFRGEGKYWVKDATGQLIPIEVL